MTFQDVMTQVAKFTYISAAVSYGESHPNRWIILGDDGKYWVTTYRYAQWLEKNGYEILT